MLKFRIIGGCLMGAAFLLTVHYMHPIGIWIAGLAIPVLCQLEFYRMVNKAGIPTFRVVGVVCGLVLISTTYVTLGPTFNIAFDPYRWEQFVLLGSIIAILVRQFPQKHNEKPLETIACTLLGIWYVPYLFNYFTRLAFAWSGPTDVACLGKTGRMLILYMVIVVKCTDIGAYSVGMLFGRHKFFPRISPKKTWEGFFGGLATAVLASVIFCAIAGGKLGQIQLGYVHALVLGALLGFVSVVGDLFESLIKRASNAKDSSSALPGHGGVLDVIDSLLFGAPAMYVYTRLFLS